MVERECQAEVGTENQAQLIPWYHYVPVRYDYGDVFDTMAFFAGQPNTREFGRDDLAQEIGARGRHFAMHRMRCADA